jgi:serine O-acetyltransferase
VSLSQSELREYVRRQLNTLFADGKAVATADFGNCVEMTLERVEACFRRSIVRRYCADGEANFSHLYSDQYLMFLWFLSSTLWRSGSDASLFNKVYLLNKALHAFDCAFDTALPDVFLVIHGVGTVLGKAEYSNGLVVYHGCTVGQAHGKYPRLASGVGLGTGAALLGCCEVGSHSSIGAGCNLVNATVPASSSVYRDNSGKLVITATQSASIASEYFAEEYLRSLSA